jgi:hypothetical protein
MASKLVAYNSGTVTAYGTKYGNHEVGVAANDYRNNNGGLTWYNSPNFGNDYVIISNSYDLGLSTQGNSRPVFWVATSDSDFIAIVNKLIDNRNSTPLGTVTDTVNWVNASNKYYLINTPSAFVTSNLILHLDPSNTSSYPGSGIAINDLSVNGLNGVMSNISFTSPYFTYNGTSSQISVADNALLEPGSGSWTMEVWVNQSVTGNDVVLGKFNNGGLSQNVSYSIRTTGGTFYAQIGSGSGSGATLFVNSTSHASTLNTWYQIVYVFKNGVTKTLETFVNGSSIGTVNHSLAGILNSTNPLYIGSYNGGEYPQWFDGKIGITRLYNTSLTSSQVLQNFNVDKSKYGL